MAMQPKYLTNIYPAIVSLPKTKIYIIPESKFKIINPIFKFMFNRHACSAMVRCFSLFVYTVISLIGTLYEINSIN